MTGLRLLAALTLSAAAALGLAGAAAADPPPWADPHYPDPMHQSCAGGMGGFIYGFCDGEHYPDGSYWHQITWSGGGSKPQCMLDGQPAPPTGCGGYGGGPAVPAP